MRRVRVAKRVPASPPPSSADTPNAESGAPTKRRSRSRWTLAIIGVAALTAVIATTDRGRAPTDALEECEDYAATLRRCFGDQVGARAPAPPSTKEGRAAAAKRCAADRARIERACR
jgi:hypothetical protein